jgi:hypothetical protein
MSDWWKLFVDDIKRGLKMLCNERRENIKIYNPNLLCLFESLTEYERIFNNTGISFRRPEELSDDYEYFGYTEFNIKDILEALNNDKNIEWFN